MGKHEHEYLKSLDEPLETFNDPKKARHCGCFGHLCGKPERHTAVRVGMDEQARTFTLSPDVRELMQAAFVGNPLQGRAR